MRSFLQFGVLSGIGWLLDCGLLLLLTQGFGAPLSIANVFSSSTAALTVFTISRLLIFESAAERTGLRTLLYACYTFGIIAAASAIIGPIGWWSQRVAEHFAIVLSTWQVSFLAKVLVTPPQLLANFFMSRFLAERKIQQKLGR